MHGFGSIASTSAGVMVWLTVLVTAAAVAIHAAGGRSPNLARTLLQRAEIMPGHPVATTVLALALVGTLGINCAIIAGFLSWQGGADPANAILKGGAAFGATLVIGIALLAALNVL
jgi:hypothetical protein